MADLGLSPDWAFFDYKDGYNFFHQWRTILNEDEAAQAVKDLKMIGENTMSIFF